MKRHRWRVGGRPASERQREQLATTLEEHQAADGLIAAALAIAGAAATWRVLHAGCMAAETARPEAALAVLSGLQLGEAEAMLVVQLLDQLGAACGRYVEILPPGRTAAREARAVRARRRSPRSRAPPEPLPEPSPPAGRGDPGRAGDRTHGHGNP